MSESCSVVSDSLQPYGYPHVKRKKKKNPQQKHKIKNWDFLGSPVIRTPCFQCRGPGSTPGWETKISQAVLHDQKHFKIKPKKN